MVWRTRFGALSGLLDNAHDATFYDLVNSLILVIGRVLVSPEPVREVEV